MRKKLLAFVTGIAALFNLFGTAQGVEKTSPQGGESKEKYCGEIKPLYLDDAVREAKAADGQSICCGLIYHTSHASHVSHSSHYSHYSSRIV